MKGLAGARRWRSSCSASEIAAISAALEASPGDLLLLVADDAGVAAQALGALRLELAERFGLAPTDAWKLLWVTDFPLLEWNDDEGRWDSLHHPFTLARREEPSSCSRPQPASALARALTTWS